MSDPTAEFREAIEQQTDRFGASLKEMLLRWHTEVMNSAEKALTNGVSPAVVADYLEAAYQSVADFTGFAREENPL